jgi:hypothetical protein
VADLRGQVHEAYVLTHAVDDVDRVPPDAARVRPVEVLDPGEPLRRSRVDEPAQRAGQFVIPLVPNRERSRAAVV